MRHDPYRSPWRRIVVVAALVVLAALIVAGVTRVGQRNESSPQPTPTSSRPAPTNEPAVQVVADKALTDAVYSFTEAYNLPASRHRNELLKQLSTPEGYGMVYRDPGAQSAAEKAAGSIDITAVHDDSSIQIEPFDDGTDAVSVYAEITIRIIRDEAVLDTVRLPAQTTSWVKQQNGWKFAYIQP